MSVVYQNRMAGHRLPLNPVDALAALLHRADYALETMSEAERSLARLLASKIGVKAEFFCRDACA